MNTLETLYFPETAIISDRQFPLFLLFSTVHIIEPIETLDEPDKQMNDTFMVHHFCQAHTPHPLGKDRDRFLYLIEDIKNRKDDYATQLKQLTIASMSATKNTGESTKQHIISSLLGQDTQNDEDNTEKLEELWKARLILKIAEIFDREQEETAQAFVQLEESESRLFAKLQGTEEDDGFKNLQEELLKIKSKLVTPPIESIQKRLESWFLLAANDVITQSPIWTTGRQEVADILFENHREKTGNAPTLIAEIELPVRIDGDQDHVQEKILGFRAESKNYQNDLSAALLEIQKAPENKGDIDDLLKQWKSVLEIHFPVARYGRTAVSFYLFEKSLSSYSGFSNSTINTETSILALFTP